MSMSATPEKSALLQMKSTPGSDKMSIKSSGSDRDSLGSTRSRVSSAPGETSFESNGENLSDSSPFKPPKSVHLPVGHVTFLNVNLKYNDKKRSVGQGASSSLPVTDVELDVDESGHQTVNIYINKQLLSISLSMPPDMSYKGGETPAADTESGSRAPVEKCAQRSTGISEKKAPPPKSKQTMNHLASPCRKGKKRETLKRKPKEPKPAEQVKKKRVSLNVSNTNFAIPVQPERPVDTKGEKRSEKQAVPRRHKKIYKPASEKVDNLKIQPVKSELPPAVPATSTPTISHPVKYYPTLYPFIPLYIEQHSLKCNKSTGLCGKQEELIRDIFNPYYQNSQSQTPIFGQSETTDISAGQLKKEEITDLEVDQPKPGDHGLFSGISVHDSDPKTSQRKHFVCATCRQSFLKKTQLVLHQEIHD